MRLILALVLVLSGCAMLPSGSKVSEAEMMTAAAALTKVSAATEANLRYGSSTEMLSDADFLAQSVAHDPGLLLPLSAYQIKSMRTDVYSAILLCTQDGAKALLEDAGCTAALDRHRWRDDPGSSCAFTVELKRLCPSATAR